MESCLRKILLQQIITRRLAIKIVSVSVEQTSEIFQTLKAESTVDKADKQKSVRIIFRAVFTYSVHKSEGSQHEEGQKEVTEEDKINKMSAHLKFVKSKK